MAFDDKKADDNKGKDLKKEHRDQGNFIPGEQTAENQKDEDPNVIARAWEAAKESLGFGATDKQESQGEREK